MAQPWATWHCITTPRAKTRVFRNRIKGNENWSLPDILCVVGCTAGDILFFEPSFH